MTAASDQRWYVASLKPLENWLLVMEHLQRYGFESYVAVQKRRMFQAGIAIYTEEPLFRGYILAKFDLADEMQSWRQINRIPGIKHLLPQHSEYPTALPLGFVEEIQARPALRDVLQTIREKYQTNDLVRILAGPLAGQTGTVLSSNLTSTWVKHNVLGRISVATGNIARA